MCCSIEGVVELFCCSNGNSTTLHAEFLLLVDFELSEELKVDDVNQLELWKNDTVLDLASTPSQLGFSSIELVGLCRTNAWQYFSLSLVVSYNSHSCTQQFGETVTLIIVILGIPFHAEPKRDYFFSTFVCMSADK